MNPNVFNIISIALAIISFGTILYFGLKTGLLRESVPNVHMKKRMFSMGRFQLWVWTLVICPVFILFWGFSYSHGIDLNPTAVILLGIPAGVAVTAGVISSSQTSELTQSDHVACQVYAQNSKNTSQVQSDAITAAVESPSGAAPITVASTPSPTILKMHQVSKSFFIDLISGDDGQLSLGRLQQFIFTIVFIVIYITTFFSTEMSKLPEFGPEVFALMGISSGTYLVAKGMNK